MRWMFLHYAYEERIRPDVGGLRKLWELAAALQGQGHEVLVLYPKLPGFVPLRAVPARPYPVIDRHTLRPLSAYAAMFLTAIRAGRRARPDVVYFRSGENVLPPLIGRCLRARTVLEVNGDAHDFFRREGARRRASIIASAERLNARRSDLIVALTPGLKQSLVKRYGIVPGKIHVIPSGTDPEHFAPGDAAALKARLGINAESPVVGFVGLFYRHQGVQTLLRAAPEMLRIFPTLRLLIVGDGLMRGRWEALAADLDVKDVAQFTGQVPYDVVPEYLRAMDLLATPFTADYREASPFKVLDALASARPVVSSDLPWMRNIRDVAGDAVTLVTPDDPKALANGIIELLSDPARRTQLGQQGRSAIEWRFSWSAVAAALAGAVAATPW
ncbi:MAG: glycosyltransferase family 4 protein [Candidatus Rokubacteria bacterium]|nr:glycosyltransferase family 4 protein [Candidatus Rokubacteria bacterium]MBI3827520.1 glycosyltransferase family 4 protein [Candidatus Rokubacteria bacterium]